MSIDRTSDQFLQDAYTGLGGYADGSYLVAHPRESGVKLDNRRALAVYPNFARKIVDAMMGFLWCQAPNRDADDLYAAFAANADNAGGKLDTLLFSYQRLAMIFGTVYVIVDKPAHQGQTRADQAYPYLALRMPGQLVAETLSASGAFESVTFAESAGGVSQYRTYTRTGWRLGKNPDGSGVLAQGEHTLGRVPVVRYHIAKPLVPTASRSQSWFYDIAGLNWDLYNARSEMVELFRGQTFAILSFPVADSAEAERLKDMTVGVENGLTYNPAGGGKPEFIAPPPTSIELYMKRMAETVDAIYKLANLEFIGNVQPSGEALKFHFNETNAALGGMAEMGEAAETEIAQLVYAWMGREFTGNISYAKEFNIADISTAIATVMDAATLGMGAEFDKALRKRLAKQILANDVSPAVLAAIDTEIDAQGDVYGDRGRREAGL